MDKKTLIDQIIKNSIETKEKILRDENITSLIQEVSMEMILSFRNGNKTLICGNGGSAADAQHIAAELSGKFYLDRDPLPAEALHVNSSFITAVANDYSYEEVFYRMVKAQGRQGDILIGISTSGNSTNILRAIEIANDKKIITIGLAGEGGGKMKSICKYLIAVPSTDTPRIQESHILIGHIICQIVEQEIFNQKI